MATNTNKVEIIAELYKKTVLNHINMAKLNRASAIASMLNRPQSVRVGKMASFSISDGKSTKAIKDLVEDEDQLFHITNLAYKKLELLLQPEVESATVDSKTFAALTK